MGAARSIPGTPPFWAGLEGRGGDDTEKSRTFTPKSCHPAGWQKLRRQTIPSGSKDVEQLEVTWIAGVLFCFYFEEVFNMKASKIIFFA